jgi:hypothetical protein
MGIYTNQSYLVPNVPMAACSTDTKANPQSTKSRPWVLQSISGCCKRNGRQLYA